MMTLWITTIQAAQAIVPGRKHAPGPIKTTHTWKAISCPTVGASSALTAVAAATPRDAWAVGYSQTQAFTTTPLLEHWNGSSWSVETGAQGSTPGLLVAVAEIAPNNVWTIGTTLSMQATPSPLIEHWDGTSWQNVLSPAGNYTLLSLAARSAQDIWAVGYSDAINQPGTYQTLIEHWNGTSWQIVASPSPGEISTLTSVSVLSPTDAWAVGNQSGGIAPQTLIEHWDGQSWSVVPSPNQGTVPNQVNALNGVTALSGQNVWAVGTSSNRQLRNAQQTLIEHWNGSTWTIANSPTTTGVHGLVGVTSHANNDVWALDTTQTQSSFLHWNGTQWTTMQALYPGSNPALNGIANIPGTATVWAVGSYTPTQNATTSNALCELYQ